MTVSMAAYVANARRLLSRAVSTDMSRRLARGSAVTFVIFAVGNLVGFLSLVALARWMTIEEFGTYAWVTNWVFVLSTVAGCGFDTATLRFIPAHRAQGHFDLMRGFRRVGYLISICGGVAVALLTTGAIYAFSGGTPSHQLTVLAVGMWMLPATSVLAYQANLARSIRHLMLAFIPGRILRFGIVVIAAFALTFTTTAVTSRQLVIASAVGISLLVVVQGLLINRAMPREALDATPRYNTRFWVSVAMPLVLIALIQDTMRRTDVLMIGALLDTRDVGIYNVATRVASLVSFVLSAVNGMASPMIAASYARGDRKELQRLVSLIAHITFWPSVAVALGLAAFSSVTLGLFGKDFHSAEIPLLILLVGQLVNAGTGSVGYILNMTGHERDAAFVHIVTMVFNVVAVYLGIRFGGLIGAAIASTLSVATWNLWLHVLVVRKLNIFPSVLSIAFLQRPQGEHR